MDPWRFNWRNEAKAEGWAEGWIKGWIKACAGRWTECKAGLWSDGWADCAEGIDADRLVEDTVEILMRGLSREFGDLRPRVLDEIRENSVKELSAWANKIVEAANVKKIVEGQARTVRLLDKAKDSAKGGKSSRDGRKPTESQIQYPEGFPQRA